MKHVVAVLFLLLCTFAHGRLYKQSQADSLAFVLKDQKGKERIHTLLHLADCYYYIQIDTAMSYATKAKKGAEEQGYDWGFYKGEFLIAKLQNHYTKNSEVKKKVEECIRWFDEHHYAEDLLYCKVLYLECLVNDTPVDEVEQYIIPLIAMAKQQKNDRLLGEIWHLRSYIQQYNIYTNSIYLTSLDSALAITSRSSDSLLMIQVALEKIRQDNGDDMNNRYMQCIQKLKQWNNRMFLIEAYNHLTFSYAVNNQIDTAVLYSKISLQVGAQYGSKVYQLFTNNMAGFVFRYNGVYEKSIDPYKRAEKASAELGNLYNQYKVLRSIGAVYEILQEYEKTIQCYLKSIELAKRLKHESYVYLTKASLANLFMVTKEYDKAEHLIDEVLMYVRTEMKGRLRKKYIGQMHHYLGKLNYKKKGYEKAQFHIDSSLHYFFDVDYAGAGRMLQMKLSLFLDMNMVDSAAATYALIQSHEKLVNVTPAIDFYLQEGRLYHAQKKYRKAIQSLEYFVANSPLTYHSPDRLLAHEILYQTHQKLGNFKAALESHIELKAIDDSIKSVNAIENLALIQSRYELAEKKTELSRNLQEQEIQQLTLASQQAQIEQQQQNFFLLFLGILIVGSWGLFLFNRYRLHQKNKRLLLEVEQEKTMQQLEMAELRSDFFTNVSHEFRTPLTLLLGPLKKLMDQVPHEYRTNVDRAYRNARHLNSLIDETLELSKLENGHLPLVTIPTLIGTFVAKVAQRFLSLSENNKVELEIKDQSGASMVDVDERKLKKVLVNLLGNAFKHTKTGDKISVLVQAPQNGIIAILIEDNGKGVAAEHIPYLFDRFYQVDHNSKGSGVGLALSKQLIELHGGSISVESELGKGACFTITLPVKSVEVNGKTNGKVVEKKEEEMAVSIDFSEQKTVLIIEDHDELRSYLKELLGNHYRVLEATDGLEGIEMAEESSPDLIISDIMMPYKDGLELTQQLKQQLSTSHIPIVLLTAKGSVENKLKGLETGADDYLSKPFNEAELLQRSKNLIQQREKLRELFTSNYFISPQKITQTKIDQTFVEKAITIIEEKMEDPAFTVESFCHDLAMNRTSVHLKLKALTGKNTTQFIKSIRLRKAGKLLQETSMSVSEVSYLCGFGSRETFNKSFKEQFNVTPTVFRKSEGPIVGR